MRALRSLLTVSLVATTLTIGNIAVIPSASAATNRTVCASGCAYTTIQAAINAATAGDTINVGAGTYTENVIINKRLIIYGAGNGSNPLTNTIITAASSGISTVVYTAGGSDASNRQSLRDLRVTGATGGTGNNNSGILFSGGSMGYFTIENIVSTNNAGHGLVSNLAPASATLTDVIITGSAFSNNGSAGIRTASHSVDGFNLTNSTFTSNSGLGLAFNSSDNATAQIGGVTLNGVTFSGNNSTADLYAFRMLGNMSLTNVDFLGSNGSGSFGLYLLGGYVNQASAPAIGTVILNDVTVSGTYTSAGISFLGYSNLAGVSMADVVLNTTVPTADRGHMRLNGVAGTLDLGNTAFGGTTPLDIRLSSNFNSGGSIATVQVDATDATFNGVLGSAMSLSQLFAVEDRIRHTIDGATDATGFVRVKSGQVFVTANSFALPATTPSIQRGVDAATAGDTINVGTGTYTENVSITKPLTILGPKAATSPTSSDTATSWGSDTTWAVVKAASGNVFSLSANADGTVIKGLAITSTNGNVTPAANGVIGINLLGPDNITIQNNYFYDLYNVAIYSTGASPRATGYLIDSNLIANAKGPFDSNGTYRAEGFAGANPWYIDNLIFSNNRIFGYGRGVQLEENSNAKVQTNYISDIYYHGIQAANGQTNTLIEGNTVDRAQMSAYDDYLYGGYCTGGIRLWTNATSSGFIVRNNLVSNTGATQRSGIADDYRDLCPAIALNGSNSAAVSSITNNSLANGSNRSGSTNPGLGIVWTANQITHAAVSSGIATVKTFESNSLATNDVVTISGLGAPFDGTWTITKSGTKTVTFAVSAADVARGAATGGFYNAPSEATAILASAGATIVRTSGLTQVGAISAANNYWGSAGGPGTTGSTVNAGGASITSSPYIASYTNDPSKAGQPGFWPINTLMNESLSGLSLSSGTLSPVFASGTSGYTASVANTTDSMTVTPTKRESGATIQVRVNSGSYATVTSGSASSSLSLNEGSNTIDVKVTAPDGTTTQTYTVTLTKKSAQSITFTQPSDMTTTSDSQTLTATSNATGGSYPVSFASTTTGTCSVINGAISVVAAGNCSIRASQAGDGIYDATSIDKSITISKATQSITNFAPTAMTMFSGAQTLSATKGAGSAPVIFTTTSSTVCLITITALTVVDAGTCVITAAQAEDETYTATSIDRSITISKIAQSITFMQPTDMTMTSDSQTLTATSNATGGSYPVSFASLTTSTCTITNGAISVVATGICSISATQAGDRIYAAANVNKSISITSNKLSQSITFNRLADMNTRSSNQALTATSSAGASYPVSLTSNSQDICTISSRAIVVVKSGTCSITASQAGNGTYKPADSVTRTVVISKVSQSITFSQPAAMNVTSNPRALSATTTADGRTVGFSSLSAACIVAEGVITVAAAGTCSITASQAGDDTYTAAVSVSRSVVISKLSQAIDFTQPTPMTVGAGNQELTATSNATGSYVVTFASSNNGICTIVDGLAGVGRYVRVVAPGTCSITASQAGDTTYAAATAVVKTFVIPKLTQSISFTTPAAMTVTSDPQGLIASSNANGPLTVKFTSTTTRVCRIINGNTLQVVSVGACSITASQAGNATYAAARNVVKSLVLASGKRR